MTIGSSLSLKVAIESPYLWMNWFIDGWPSDITSEAMLVGDDAIQALADFHIGGRSS